MSKQLKSAAIGCRACNMTVPDQNYAAIRTATGSIFVCGHHEGDWIQKVKAAAEKICNLAGPMCNNIAGLSEKVRIGTHANEIAGFAEKLLEAVYKKADQLKTSAKENLADLRKALFALIHLLGYKKTAVVFI